MKTQRLLQLLVTQVHAQTYQTKDETELKVLENLKHEIELAELELEQAS